jgi:hypothetical protein
MRALWIYVFLVFFIIKTSGQPGVANMLQGAEGLFAKIPVVWGMEAYPAALASQRSAQAGIYAERRFMRGPDFFHLAFSGEIFKEHFLLSASREGTNAFSYNRIGLAVGKQISPVFQIALRISYTGFSARGYAGRGSLGAGLGAVLQLSEQVRFGVQADQLNALVSENPDFPFRLHAGLGYSLSPVCAFTIEITKESGHELVLDVGLRYVFYGNAYARMGYSPGLSLFSVSAGFEKNALRMEAGPAYHLSLGASWGLSLIYQFNRSE